MLFRSYRGFPASGAGIPGDASTRVAVFALLHDQDVNTPIALFARDAAGNEATAPVDRMAFPKPFAKSRIDVDDRFLERVVPAILSNTPDMKVPTPTDLVSTFVQLNSTLRRRNARWKVNQRVQPPDVFQFAQTNAARRQAPVFLLQLRGHSKVQMTVP